MNLKPPSGYPQGDEVSALDDRPGRREMGVVSDLS
jgi:hypothetical protein